MSQVLLFSLTLSLDVNRPLDLAVDIPSKKKQHVSITTSGSISIAINFTTYPEAATKKKFSTIVPIVKRGLSLVIMLLLNFVTIHVDHWIQQNAFGENSYVHSRDEHVCFVSCRFHRNQM